MVIEKQTRERLSCRMSFLQLFFYPEDEYVTKKAGKIAKRWRSDKRATVREIRSIKRSCSSTIDFQFLS